MKKKTPSPWKQERAALVRQAIGTARPVTPLPPDVREEAARTERRQRAEVTGPEPPTSLPPPVVMRKPVRFGPRRAA